MPRRKDTRKQNSRRRAADRREDFADYAGRGDSEDDIAAAKQDALADEQDAVADADDQRDGTR